MNNVNKQMTHRQKQALATRTLIVDTSRRLFLEQGYGVTTIEAIATEAGVAVSTVYAIFKNKRGILQAIRQAWHEESGQASIYQSALDQPDAAKRLALAAHATRRQWETGAAMIAIYKGAAATDAEAATELEASLASRRHNLSQFITTSAPLLNPDLTQAQAAAIFLALTHDEIYRELVEQNSWTADAYEQWLSQTLQQQLLLRSA
ncbi:MAG: TetR/AcrR family transcriptional regulator [Anaerolineae bacterium]|nr:TetR/AcrR family transcriptional regulator [Anaerolineae bacterium]